ncbi:MAG: TolC family protein [Phaeodactylibacter sp.]|nr:TolC family protein [Phaeodactylibacter sp.]
MKLPDIFIHKRVAGRPAPDGKAPAGGRSYRQGARRFFFALLCLLSLGHARAQSERLSLQQLATLAQEQSVSARQAKTTMDTRYWEWRTFQSALRPQLLLMGNLPDFTRAYQEVVQPDGTVEFQSVTVNNSGLRLGLSQSIAATGGEVFASTVIQRFDDFDRDKAIYSGQPFAVGFNQPLFGYNELKWDKRIEPLRYRESQRQYLRAREEVAVEATGLYFDLLLAQVNLEMAQANLAGNDTIFKIAQEREALGQLSRNDLLQLQLSVLNARKDVAAARQDLEAAQLSLRAYVGIREEKNLSLDIPADIPAVKADEEQALQLAWANRPEVTGFERRRLQAAQAVARARGETGIEATLSASFGLSNRAARFGEIYRQPQDYESIQLQFSIPIVDWGRASSRRATARANEEFAQASIEQDKVTFEQEVRTQAKLYNMLREQLQLSYDADQIARERYRIAKDRFILGDLSITDLNLALQEKDFARRDYIQALRSFWLAYYSLRSLTLYDFERGRGLGGEGRSW